jgi:hypothetical protein
MGRSQSPFLYNLVPAVSMALLATLAGAAPALAGSHSCSERESFRPEVSDGTFRINIANRRSTPLTIEWMETSGVENSLTLAPGESKALEVNKNYALTSRDARLRCLSKFVPDKMSQTWEITTTLEGDYQRRNVGSFPVYVAPEFSREHALLERCLQVLASNVKQIEEVLPPAALEMLSGIPIWLEYERNKSFPAAYFHSEEFLPLYGFTGAKAKSIQFTSWIADMAGSKRNLLMHELAHAYHDLVLPRSYTGILSAYNSAGWSGRYNAVRHSSGRVMRAYAMTNDKEFFAELSEAYFTNSDFFPFTREDLKEFDPASYRAISDAWERPFRKTARGRYLSPLADSDPGAALCATSRDCLFRDSLNGPLRGPHRRQYERGHDKPRALDRSLRPDRSRDQEFQALDP